MTPELIAPLSSLAMVLIWLFYLHLFWSDQKRINRPFLVIHHATSQSPGAPCLLVNMSKEPVHVQCVFVRVYAANDTRVHYLTDYSRFDPGDDAARAELREGPLQPGGYLVLGSFEDIVLGRDVGFQQRPDRDQSSNALSVSQLKQVSSFEICVAVNYGQKERPVGARRAFFVEEQGNEMAIRAYNIYTEQLTSRKRQKTVIGWVETRLEPKLRGSSQSEQSEQRRPETEEEQ